MCLCLPPLLQAKSGLGEVSGVETKVGAGRPGPWEGGGVLGSGPACKSRKADTWVLRETQETQS